MTDWINFYQNNKNIVTLIVSIKSVVVSEFVFVIHLLFRLNSRSLNRNTPSA